MNNKVIYTSLTAGYDKLPQYEVVDPEFDYICFTNDYPNESKQGIWTIRSIPLEIDNNIILSRFVKLLPHHVLNKYEYSLWVDSNLIITDSRIYEIVNSKILDGGKWYGIKHPNRDCIYDEANVCFQEGRVGFWEAKRQMDIYRKDNYPTHYGLFENNFILRKHNDEIVKKIDEKWWVLFQKYTKRDQLSLFYIFWKSSFIPNAIFENGVNTRNVEGITHRAHLNPTIIKRVISYALRKCNHLIGKVISI